MDQRFPISAALIPLVLVAIALPATHGQTRECTRLSGPPAYPLPVLAMLDAASPWGPAAFFRTPLVSGGPEEIVGASCGREHGWALWRLAIVGPDTGALERVLQLPDHGEDDRLERIVAGDVDGDGLLDLLLTWKQGDSGGILVELHLGRGDARFEKAETLVLAHASVSTTVLGDWDGDGADELLLESDADLGRVRIYEYEPGQGFRTRTSWSEFGAGSFRAVDVDRDGVEDLLYMRTRYGWEPRVVVRFGGEGFFDRARTRWRGVAHGASVFPRFVGAERAVEIVIVARRILSYGEELVSLHTWSWEESRGTWRPESSQDLPPGRYRRVRSWDVDGDGIRDLVFDQGRTGNHTGGFVLLRAHVDAPYELVHGSRLEPFLLGVMQIDGDGIPDALVARGRAVSRFRGLPGGGFDEAVVMWPRGFERYGAAASGDLDADGADDLVVSTARYSEPEWNYSWWRSLGDGTFTEQGLPSVAGSSPAGIEIRDLDADGAPDLVAHTRSAVDRADTLFVAWGPDDPAERRWRAALDGFWISTRILRDLDGDGDLDLLVWGERDGDWRLGGDVLVFLLDGRQYRLAWSEYTPPFQPRADPRLVAADIDGDGRADAVRFVPDPRSTGRALLVWSRNEGDGTFAPAQTLREGWYVDSLPRVDVDDVDRDGDDDLVMRGTGRDADRVTVLGSDRGRLRTFFSASPGLDTARLQPVDLDHDGLLDLVEVSGSERFRVWMADGTGGFVGLTQEFFFGELLDQVVQEFPARVLGGGGADLVRIRPGFDAAREGVTTLPQTTPTLDRDIAAPEVVFLAWPEVDTGDVDRFSGAWRVSGRASDECTVARVTRVLVRAPAIDPATAVHFRPGPREEIRLYESPEGGGQEVVLEGRDEATLRERFEEMLARGGFDVVPNSFLELTATGEWGHRAQELGDTMVGLPAARLTHRWRLGERQLEAVVVQRPDGDILFTVEATDGAGHAGAAGGSFLEQRRSFCSGASAREVVCR